MDLICSRCGGAVRDEGGRYSCRCFALGKVVAGKQLSPDDVRNLFALGRKGNSCQPPLLTEAGACPGGGKGNWLTRRLR